VHLAGWADLLLRTAGSSSAPLPHEGSPLDVFADLTRRVRETIWLTPEPRYSWALGGCDLPAYAESCDRVEVIRDHSGLESWATDVVTRASR
jgi:hypothetical protein